MKKLIIYAGLLTSLLGTGCNKMLEEEPKSILTPEFLKTELGIRRGLDAAYAGTRYYWGSQDLFVLTVGATDEFRVGVDGNADLNNYASGYNTGNGNCLQMWRQAYIFINACNGLLENVPLVDISDAEKAKVIAEAKFLRAQYYFVLVQFFRDVTVTLKFQTGTLATAKRDPLAAAYDVIIQDLKDAIAVLPPGPKSVGLLPGKANAAAARHLLGRVYMTRANSGVAKPTDNEDAYQTFKALIDESAGLGLSLLPDFKDIFREGNENNNEVLWTVQHTSNYAYNGPNNSAAGDNVLNHMFVGQYEKKKGGMIRSMEYGRPYIRVMPTNWLLETAFKEKINDTRYHKTFQTVWFANSDTQLEYDFLLWPTPLPAGAPPGAVAGKQRIKKKGDTSIYLPTSARTQAQIDAAPYLLVPPGKYGNTLGPTVTKYFDTKRADLNDQSVRPVIVYRLADTYLMAAEAAFKTSRTPEAVNYINAIRERATYPTGNPVTARITAADVTIDYILDERSRELAGENTRWWDLNRNNKLIERVKKWNTDAGKNIQDRHVVRPIPQNQIDNTRGEKYNNSLYFEGWN